MAEALAVVRSHGLEACEIIRPPGQLKHRRKLHIIARAQLFEDRARFRESALIAVVAQPARADTGGETVAYVMAEEAVADHGRAYQIRRPAAILDLGYVPINPT